MAALESILVGAATRVGAPIVKRILVDAIGGKGGEIAGRVIDTIAGHAGVVPEELPEVAPRKLDAAVKAAEADTPELILAEVESQKATHAFLVAEKKPGWVNGWQWFLMFLWGWNGVGVTAINYGFAADLPVIPWNDLGWLTVIYQGLNMGGHWSSRMADKFLKARPA